MHTLRLKAATMAWHEQGDPAGIPLLFIHGFPFSHGMWDPQLKALSPSVRAIAPDLRGFGKSLPTQYPLTIEFFIDDLFSLLDHLKIPTAIFCGLSMGGYIALRAYEREPERFLGMILADTRSEADDNAGKIKRSASVKAIQESGREIFAEGFLKNIFAPASFHNHPEAISLIRNIILQNTPDTITGALQALASRTDTTHVLGSISVPTLVMVGEQDILTPPTAAEHMHLKIPNSSLVVLGNAGHMANLEASNKFNTELIRYLSTNFSISS